MFGGFGIPTHRMDRAGFGVRAPDVYSKQFTAYPGAFSEQGTRVNNGGRVLLPAACLAEMSTMSLAYPLQFEIRTFAGESCFAGVLEFEAEQGTIILPNWMFDMLLLQPGDTVRLKTVALPPGKLITLRPQQRKFIELANPKLVLEQRLINYPVITKGSSIVINYIDQEFIIDVTEVMDMNDQPVPAISTVRADAQATELKVEFERPLDMPPSPVQEEVVPFPVFGSNVIGAGGVDFKPLEFKPPTLSDPAKSVVAGASSSNAVESNLPAFKPFRGVGRVVGDSSMTGSVTSPTGFTVNNSNTGSGQKLGGQGNSTTAVAGQESVNEKRFKAFAGAGRSLRDPNPL